MKILALFLLFPYPPTQGKSQRRTYNFLKYLNETHSVTLLTQTDEETSLLNLKKLRESVDEVVIFPNGMSQSKIEHQILEKKITEQLKLPLLRRYEQKYCAKFSSIVTINLTNYVYSQNCWYYMHLQPRLFSWVCD